MSDMPRRDRGVTVPTRGSVAVGESEALGRRCFLRLAGGAALAPLALIAAPARGAELVLLSFSDIYLPGMTEFSPLMDELAEERVAMRGYMAPPLKPEATFFVLTSVPLAICPFCAEAADWPRDIVFVRTRNVVRLVPFEQQIAVTGRLEMGWATDEETGFVSRVRLVEATYQRD